jgi:hypothetical protein
MNLLTPEKLRTIADSLDSETKGNSECEFICIATRHLFDTDHSEEMKNLLIGLKVPLDGMLYLNRDSYDRDAMSVRFMLLEFMALEMESRVSGNATCRASG